ncbi:hypothetical protein [Rhodopseudomonas telluris]|uniref:Uncharacterized protein n=1 Tax=Rhodopseudomonas telluris TaxID=644215 RepID=A0ABV6EZR0_9BRAD
MTMSHAQAQAQQPATPAQQPAQQQPASPPTAPPQPSPAWGNLPKLVLERQFAGPLQDTIVQRWRDPVDNSVCYIYLPISVPHSPTTSSGFVQYGGNSIGSISCLPGSAPRPSAPGAGQTRKP